MTTPNWRNRTLWTGDNLDIMRGMNSESVDLIYLDPPFNSNRNYAAPIGSEAAGAAFKDTWTLNDVDEAWHGEIADRMPPLYAIIDAAGLAHGKGMKSYLIMMAVRLMEMQRLLKGSGSLYLHCDRTASHYLKSLMDAIFGKSNFVNEIVWCYEDVGGRATNYFKHKHDIILFYQASGKRIFNIQRKQLAESTIKRYAKYFDANGQITYERLRDTNPGVFRKLKGIPEDLGRVWLDIHRGGPLNDWWTDISAVKRGFAESTSYPTQKPLNLLERIIKASSNEGDTVLDPFCGCATALVAADRFNREWVGIDLSPLAARLVLKRLREDRGPLFDSVIHREDIPRRTDLGEIPNYRTHKHTLYGKQEGLCGGCQVMFPFRNMTVDHIVPQAKAGSDHIDNLQLLCNACNSMKGTGSQEEFIARLQREGLR